VAPSWPIALVAFTVTVLGVAVVSAKEVAVAVTHTATRFMERKTTFDLFMTIPPVV
jgi:hypothetical protein